MQHSCLRLFLMKLFNQNTKPNDHPRGGICRYLFVLRLAILYCRLTLINTINQVITKVCEYTERGFPLQYVIRQGRINVNVKSFRIITPIVENSAIFCSLYIS